MYYVFTHSREWQGREIYAEPLEAITYRDYEPPHWWDALPLRKPLPHLTFAVDTSAGLVDNYATGFYELYSDRLINLIAEAGVRFETFPATLVDRKIRQPLSVNYAIFHLLEMHPALDRQKSDLGDDRLTDVLSMDPNDSEARKLFRKYLGSGRLIVSQERLSDPRPMFRVSEENNLVFIHEDLKAILQSAGMRGCLFVPVEKYRTGLLLEE